MDRCRSPLLNVHMFEFHTPFPDIYMTYFCVLGEYICTFEMHMVFDSLVVDIVVYEMQG